jgi:hypothetical protein
MTGRQRATSVGTCGTCDRTIKLTSRGRLNQHNDPATGRRCAGWRFGMGEPVTKPTASEVTQRESRQDDDQHKDQDPRVSRGKTAGQSHDPVLRR